MPPHSNQRISWLLPAVFRAFARFGFGLWLMLAAAEVAWSQAPKTEADELAKAYNAAMQAFAAQKWAEAASGLEGFLKLVPDDKEGTLGGVFFSLGAAHYNAPNYPRAIEVFKQYLAKFPSGERVTEVRLAITQANMLSKNYDEAIRAFKALESMPQFRDQALMAQAMAYKEMSKPELQINTLEKLIQPEIKSSIQAGGALILAELLTSRKQAKRALELLMKLQTKADIVENLVSLNALAVKLGDQFSDEKNYADAINSFRIVRSRAEVLKLQANRVTTIERRMEANLKNATGNPQALAQAQMANLDLKAKLSEQKQLLENFEKLPDFAAALMFRIGRAWYDWEKRWESIVVFNRILTRFPEAKEQREPSLFAMILAYADLNQPKRAQQLCEQYMKEFPEGPNNGTVGYMAGAVALQAGDYAGAESFFGIMIGKVADASYKEEMQFLMGNAKFQQGKFDEAIKVYEAVLNAYPTGQNAEDATYRIAACNVFLGNYEVALGKLQAYLEKYSAGIYAADAKYRVGVCYYAANEFDTVIERCLAFQKEHPGDPVLGEVLSLLGDAYAAKDQRELAIEAYKRSYKVATTDEVLNYSLFEAGKHVQKLGQWEDLANMYSEFVKEKPDHPSVVSAMFWIARAREKLGQIDAAKILIVENLQKYIAEPKRDGVEQILSQLAQIVSKRPRPVAKVEAEATPTETVANANPEAPAVAPIAVEPPPLPSYDAVAELDRLLKPLAEGANGTTKARLLYAKAELAKLLRKEAEAADLAIEITERFKPDELSPALLALAGDRLLAKGDHPRAATFYVKLRDDFPKSDYLDSAYVGLGEIEFSKKAYEKALELFTDALEKPSGSMKMKDAMLAKARTLAELGRYDEARKLFEQVASIREWRGDSTAYAVFSLGEIEARQGRWAEAIAYYRRVFVAYQKYLPWVAKAYLRSADSFEKWGKRQDAIDSLKDMLRNDKLQTLPEYEEARGRLAQWGVNAG